MIILDFMIMYNCFSSVNNIIDMTLSINAMKNYFSIWTNRN